MNENKPQEKENKPFFARFLETQEQTEASSDATTKYPSDNDEYWP